jgi:hypothetical protein
MIMPQPKKESNLLEQILTVEQLGLILHNLNNVLEVIEEVVVASVEVAAVIAVVSEEAVVASVEVAAVTVEASEEAVVVSEEAVEEVEVNYYFNFYTYFFIFKKIRRSSWWSIP